ncbi:type IX secretion system membrane protein PorP/SprF [Flavobacterium sp.]|jgi:type IX secretion system PorP/SprF family membrane protein|uniref:PorP/SprF family type IX secretion system membrane protein n=1 Tax=Flavobacterium sp. TaxID=239 RepID=UPI002639C82A|nr:type IX secretion system membrane protein PorP/SprF [Flavobacterium sp.]
MKKLYFLTAFAFLTFLDVSAQQDPNYTQYMYNMSVINPAYAGSKESMSGGLLYRKQWVNIEGSPETATFFLHTPAGKNVGLGLSAINDKIGPVEETNVYGDFSYTLNLGGENRLAFGLKGGATFHKVGLYSDIGNGNVPDPNDPAFSQNTNRTFLNIGTGVFYYTNKYYVALSIPNMLKSKYLDFNGRQFGTETMHYFLTGGYVFDLTDNVKFKPFAMVKTAFNAPVSFDLSTNFLFYQKFEIGATYRKEDSFGAMVNYAITPNLRIGYAYDQVVSDLKVTTPSSHEVFLLFDLNFPKKVSQSPRYF